MKRLGQLLEQEENGRGVAGSGPRAMTRVLRLFDCLARRRSGMTLSELSQAMGVPKSTFLASLRALAADGFLICEDNVYRLGPCAYRLAGNIIMAWSQPDIVRHYVKELAEATGESVGFAIADWDIGQAIFTDAVNSAQPVHYAMRAGIRAPLYASAAGRVLLAYAAPDQQHDYITRGHFRALTPSTRTTPDRLTESLDAIRRLGYCASFGEMLKDTAAIAVPVFDASDCVIGALIVAAPLNRLRAGFEPLLASIRHYGRLASGLPPGDPAEP
ncbi:IclR family transcriptional regulator [Niveispirillum fermenti]|uniref:IclR family transcriptional regulator n=1 Tax=Niveispirillum fermenti TaxID=1233113 RepID=UPI003A89CA64